MKFLWCVESIQTKHFTCGCSRINCSVHEAARQDAAKKNQDFWLKSNFAQGVSHPATEILGTEILVWFFDGWQAGLCSENHSEFLGLVSCDICQTSMCNSACVHRQTLVEDVNRVYHFRII